MQVLDLRGTGVTAGGLRRLPARALRSLNIGKSGCTCDEGLEVIAHLYGESLRELDASQGAQNITDNGLVLLGGCHRLRLLDVGGCSITDQGLKALVGSPAGASLQVLNVSSCRSVSRRARTASAVSFDQLKRHLMGPC